jgi:hypothetical protein
MVGGTGLASLVRRRVKAVRDETWGGAVVGGTGLASLVRRRVKAVRDETWGGAVVGGTGLEPVTSAMSTQCSNQLS